MSAPDFSHPLSDLSLLILVDVAATSGTRLKSRIDTLLAGFTGPGSGNYEGPPMPLQALEERGLVEIRRTRTAYRVDLTDDGRKASTALMQSLRAFPVQPALNIPAH